MTAEAGLALKGDPLLHYARRQDVVLWDLERAGGLSGHRRSPGGRHRCQRALLADRTGPGQNEPGVGCSERVEGRAVAGAVDGRRAGDQPHARARGVGIEHHERVADDHGIAVGPVQGAVLDSVAGSWDDARRPQPAGFARRRSRRRRAPAAARRHVRGRSARRWAAPGPASPGPHARALVVVALAVRRSRGRTRGRRIPCPRARRTRPGRRGRASALRRGSRPSRAISDRRRRVAEAASWGVDRELRAHRQEPVEGLGQTVKAGHRASPNPLGIANVASAS
jgi:hypothetical protein